MAKKKSVKAVEVTVSPNEIRVNGENVCHFYHGFRPDDKKYRACVITDSFIQNDTHAAVIRQDCNPGCYSDLNVLYMIDLDSGEIITTRLYDGGRVQIPAEGLKFDENGDIIVTNRSGNQLRRIKIKEAFARPLKEGDTIEPVYDKKRPETWFNYRIVEKNDIIIKLKDEVNREKLFDLPGFDMSYNLFKLSGAIVSYGQSTFLMCDTKTGKSWSVEYGNSTTITSRDVWDKRDRLINMLYEVVPTYTKIFKDVYERIRI